MKHKATLHFLLVLTFITAGLNLISYGGTALLLPQMRQMYAQTPELVPEMMRTYMDMFLALPRLYYVGAALLYVLELLGTTRRTSSSISALVAPTTYIMFSSLPHCFEVSSTRW